MQIMLEINIDVLRFPKPTSLLLAVDKQLLIANFTEPESKLSRPEQFLRDILKIERVRERLEALYVCSEIEEKKKQTEYVEMKCPVTSKLPLSLSLYIYIYISPSTSLSRYIYPFLPYQSVPLSMLFLSLFLFPFLSVSFFFIHLAFLSPSIYLFLSRVHFLNFELLFFLTARSIEIRIAI